jgi:tetratricopeptide (TPR) repeat protein
MGRKTQRYWVQLRRSKDPLMRIKAALATGEAQTAEEEARAYLAAHPADPEAFSMLAAALAMSERYELAAYYADEARRLKVGGTGLLNIKGLATAAGANRSLRDYQAAASMFRAAFDGDPNEVAAGLNLGSLYLEMGQPAPAGEVFGQVAERCDQCVPALMGRGVSALRLKRYDDAKEQFTLVLKASPEHPGALFNLAMVERQGFGNSKKAEAHLLTLLRSKKRPSLAMRERAQAYLRMIKGEFSKEERTGIAAEKKPGKSSAGDAEAEAMLTGAEAE